jgi:hypothetical protein
LELADEEELSMSVNLQSFNFRDFFIRHQNFEAELMKFDSPGFKEDFAWDLVSRGQDADGFQLVSFQPVNFPTHFLRHKNFRLVLEHKDNTDQFRKDSTFRRQNGLTGDPEQGWRSFESVNFPDFFIRHRDFHIFLEKKDTSNLKADATFNRITI